MPHEGLTSHALPRSARRHYRAADGVLRCTRCALPAGRGSLCACHLPLLVVPLSHSDYPLVWPDWHVVDAPRRAAAGPGPNYI